MIKWAILGLMSLGILLVLLCTLFAGWILKYQHDNEFDRENETYTLIHSESFKNASLEQKVIYLAVNEAESDRVRDSMQIWQSIFFLGLSAGAVMLGSGQALFFFWQNRRFNEQTRAIAKNAQTLSFLAL